MQKLKVEAMFINLPHRQASDDVPLLPEGLPDPLKQFALPTILFCVTEKHPAFG
jgi:hypothetical protein